MRVLKYQPNRDYGLQVLKLWTKKGIGVKKYQNCNTIQKVTTLGDRGYLDMLCTNKEKGKSNKQLGLWNSGNSSICGVIISETLATELELEVQWRAIT